MLQVFKSCPTYSLQSDVWYLDAIFLMRSLKANSERGKVLLMAELGTICSSLREDSPSLNSVEDEESLLLDLLLDFLIESSNSEGPER